MKEAEKWMWIITGPNGAGKTTLWNSPLLDKELGERGKDIPFINPIEVQEKLIAERREKGEAPLNIVNLYTEVDNRCDAEGERYIQEGKSFAIEMAAPRLSVLDRAEKLKKEGWKIGAVSVSVASLNLAKERVHARDYPAQKENPSVAETLLGYDYNAFKANTPRLFGIADKAILYDNSTSDPKNNKAFKEVARREEGGEMKLSVKSNEIDPDTARDTRDLLYRLGLVGSPSLGSRPRGR